MDSDIQPVNNLPEPKGSGGRKNIPLEAIIDLKSKNYSNSQIASLLKCDPSNITRRLKDIEITKQYVNHRPFILQDLQRKLINCITDAKIKKATLDRIVWSYGVLYDKERLETGKSTQNIAYADALKARDTAKITFEEIRRIRIERQSVADSNIVDISPTLDTQGVEESAQCG